MRARACSRGGDVTKRENTATLVRAWLARGREARAQRGAQQAWRARRVRPGHVHTGQLSCGKPGRGPWRGSLAGGAEPRVHRRQEGTYARLASGELLRGVRGAGRDASRFEHSSFASSNQTNTDRGGRQDEAARPAARAERRAVRVQGRDRQDGAACSSRRSAARAIMHAALIRWWSRTFRKSCLQRCARWCARRSACRCAPRAHVRPTEAASTALDFSPCAASPVSRSITWTASSCESPSHVMP